MAKELHLKYNEMLGGYVVFTSPAEDMKHRKDIPRIEELVEFLSQSEYRERHSLEISVYEGFPEEDLDRIKAIPFKGAVFRRIQKP